MTTYYVDATGGNDADPGTSEGTAWQTIAKVNASAFLPGDSILFKRGETWVTAGSALVPPSSGAAGNPITFADYGAGAKPIIDGNDATNCITANGKSYLTFQNIETTQGVDHGFSIITCEGVIMLDCDAHDCGNDNLIFFTGSHDCRVTGGAFYDAYQRTPGTIVSGIEIADGCYDILIEQVRCYGQLGSGMGITIHSHVGTGMPTGITVQNSICYNNSGHGINILKSDNTVDTGDWIVVQDNILYNNTADGIRVQTSSAQYVNGPIIRRNVIYGNTQYAFSIVCVNGTVQRNIWDGRGWLTQCQNVNFDHNSAYHTGGFYALYVSGAATASLNIRNNIIAVVQAAVSVIGVAWNVANPININYNLYYLLNAGVGNTRWDWQGVAKNWAAWLADSGQDANSPMADQDPLYVDVTTYNLALQHGSPALNIGTPIAGMPFYGAAPDCGRWEMRWLEQRALFGLHPAWKFS